MSSTTIIYGGPGRRTDAQLGGRIGDGLGCIRCEWRAEGIITGRQVGLQNRGVAGSFFWRMPTRWTVPTLSADETEPIGSDPLRRRSAAAGELQVAGGLIGGDLYDPNAFPTAGH